MASSSTDLVGEEDYDAILELFSEDFMIDDEDFNLALDGVVSVAENNVVKSFKCSLCEKVCKSKQGLSRHVNSMHHDGSTVSTAALTTKKTKKGKEPETLLHPATFRKFILECAVKLFSDMCYPQEIRSIFEHYTFSHEEALSSYNEVRDVIGGYNGDGEKFYPLFYDVVSTKNIFPRLSQKGCTLLGFEVANCILAHLSSGKAATLTESESRSSTNVEFSDKEKNIVCYLSGYVFSTVYRRLRRSTSTVKTEIAEKYLSLLLAAKSTCNESQPNEMLLNLRDRGGLWKMEPYAVGIFEQAEKLFRLKVDQSAFKIDSKDIVSTLLKNCIVLANFSKIRNSCTQEIEKELSLNLLEDLLCLYIRARTFSHVKQKRDNYKLESKKQKMNSLRKSIKKSSSALEMGH